MHDPRIEKIAHIIATHSLRLQPDEKVYLEATDVPEEIIIQLIRQIRATGAWPFVNLKQNRIQREIYRLGDASSLGLLGLWEAAQLSEMQAYIGLRGSHNVNELCDVPDAQMRLYRELWWQPVHQAIRIPKTRWVVLRWPHAAMAQQAQMSTEAFEDFYFRVCTLDYAKMAHAMQNLVERMQRTDHVRIIGPGTDLQFSIKGMPAIACAGEYNLPDGEVYTAPLKTSAQGRVRFSARSIYLGVVHEGIELAFKDGKIISAKSDKSAALNQILDSDAGARFLGEFALGVNPHITRPMLDILFDEKIAGSFHLTPGSCLDNTPNGNRSQIHWDMVCIQTPEYGGGELFFDDELIRQDGRFIPDDLKPLNPEQLL